MLCKECNQPLPEGRRICRKCGARNFTSSSGEKSPERPKKCINCGESLEGRRICTHCGTRHFTPRNTQPVEEPLLPPLTLCENCDSPLPEGRRICKTCGTRNITPRERITSKKIESANTKRCKNCGEPLPEGRRICKHCGTSNFTRTARETTKISEESETLQRRTTNSPVLEKEEPVQKSVSLQKEEPVQKKDSLEIKESIQKSVSPPIEVPEVILPIQKETTTKFKSPIQKEERETPERKTAPKPRKKRCESCGKEVTGNQTFCVDCEETLNSPTTFSEIKTETCRSCGYELLEGKSFCGNCGEQVGKSSTPPKKTVFRMKNFQLCPQCGNERMEGESICSYCGEISSSPPPTNCDLEEKVNTPTKTLTFNHRYSSSKNVLETKIIFSQKILKIEQYVNSKNLLKIMIQEYELQSILEYPYSDIISATKTIKIQLVAIFILAIVYICTYLELRVNAQIYLTCLPFLNHIFITEVQMQVLNQPLYKVMCSKKKADALLNELAKYGITSQPKFPQSQVQTQYQQNSYSPQKTMMEKAKPVVIGIIILFVLMLFGSSGGTSRVDAVKNGSPIGYPDISYDQAFTILFNNREWSAFTSTDGREIVDFKGTLKNNNNEFYIQFVVNDTMFEVHYMSINDEQQSNFEMIFILDAFFTACEAKDMNVLNTYFEDW